MKKLNILLCFLIGVFLVFSGCEAIAPQNDKLQIIATNFAEYDFARAVAGEKAQVKMLIPAGRDMHSFEPTAKDIVEIENSDLFIYIGGESDSFVERIIASLSNKKVKTLKMCEFVSLICEEEHHHSHSEVYDEHIWTSPDNAVKMISAIKNTLCEIDAEDSEYFTNNADEYISKIKALAQKTQDTIKNSRAKKIAVADRNPYKYFTEYYGLSCAAAFAACSEDTDADLQTVLTLIKTVNDEQLSAVFVTEISNRELADTVAENTGAKILTLHSYHNISTDDFLNGITYLDLMKYNCDALARGLN